MVGIGDGCGVVGRAEGAIVGIAVGGNETGAFVGSELVGLGLIGLGEGRTVGGCVGRPVGCANNIEKKDEEIRRRWLTENVREEVKRNKQISDWPNSLVDMVLRIYLHGNLPPPSVAVRDEEWVEQVSSSDVLAEVLVLDLAEVTDPTL